MRTSLDITFGAQCVECGDFIQLTRVAWDPQALELFVGVSPCGKCLGAAKLNPVDFAGLEDSWKPLPCPDCEGTGHMLYDRIEEGRCAVVCHCPRCKGSGEVVQG